MNLELTYMASLPSQLAYGSPSPAPKLWDSRWAAVPDRLANVFTLAWPALNSRGQGCVFVFWVFFFRL